MIFLIFLPHFLFSLRERCSCVGLYRDLNARGRCVGFASSVCRLQAPSLPCPVSGSLHRDQGGLIPFLTTDRPVATCFVTCCVSYDSCVGVATGAVPSWVVLGLGGSRPAADFHVFALRSLGVCRRPLSPHCFLRDLFLCVLPLLHLGIIGVHFALHRHGLGMWDV